MKHNERLEIRVPRDLMIGWATAIPGGQGSRLLRDFMEKVVVGLDANPSALLPLLRGEYTLTIEDE